MKVKCRLIAILVGVGMNKYRIILAVSFLLPIMVTASPLDALLNANQLNKLGELKVELGLDAMNNSLDLINTRAQDTQYAGTSVGDYSGLHMLMGYALTDDIAINGGWWQRNVSYSTDNQQLNSWQMDAQYRLIGNQDDFFSTAVRLSAWGDSAKSLTKSSPTTVLDRTLNSITINSLSDRQTQFDIVSTLRVLPDMFMSLFVGAGQSEVSSGDMSAKFISGNGCQYDLSFTRTSTFGQLSTPCAASGSVMLNFSTNQSILSEFSYKAKYYQMGGGLLWQREKWRLRAGYQYQHLNREEVDDAIVNSGGISYQTNHIFVGEISRRIKSSISAYARGQLMSNQFVGEIPFIIG
jgi:hypothetical protein